MLDLTAIGKYISELRELHNMTQYELADKLFVTHQAVSKWENGKSIPNIDIMVAITKLFAISIDDLITGNKPMNYDFKYLLENYPRSYVVNQLIRQKIDVRLEEILYLLNNEERSIVLNHIINNNLPVDISTLLPYLNNIERKQIIKAIKEKQIMVKISSIYHQLSQYEKSLLEVKDGY